MAKDGEIKSKMTLKTDGITYIAGIRNVEKGMYEVYFGEESDGKLSKLESFNSGVRGLAVSINALMLCMRKHCVEKASRSS